MSKRAATGHAPSETGAPLAARAVRGESERRGHSLRDAEWVWRLNDVRRTPHIFALGLSRSITRARADGGDVGQRLEAALGLVETLVGDGRIRPAGIRAEPRSGLEMFADAVERTVGAREGKRLAERRQAHEALEKLQGTLAELAAQNGERLRRPRPLAVVSLPAADEQAARRMLDRIDAVTDPSELGAAWRLTARKQLDTAARLGPAAPETLQLTRGLEALNQRMRALGVVPPTLGGPPGHSR